jgi:Family of unknown function (DUF5319)
MDPFGDAPSEGDPLDENERELLRQDLVDVETLKELLGPRGLKGVLFYCADCEEDHYLAWDLLRGNLQELLEAGESPVHEPAFDPNPEEYVTWDYARGFLDGYETLQDEEEDALTAQLVDELERRNWDEGQIGDLLGAMGIEPKPDDEGPDRR